MTKNRELLELAAKAAGWSCWQSKHGYLNVTKPDGEIVSACHNWPAFDSYTGEKNQVPTLADALSELDWNPRVDDGDALRLAVKLKFKLAKFNDGAGVWFYPFYDDDTPDIWTAYGDDELAATRDSIVRAAAEIGNAMR